MTGTEGAPYLPRVASGTVVSEAGKACEELAMTWMLLNIPLMVMFVALWAGVPLWLVLKHPDQRPEPAA